MDSTLSRNSTATIHEASAVLGTDEDFSFLGRIGIPRTLAWGFVGLLLFMIGDGVESGFLSPYLHDRGLSEKAVAGVFTIYGLFVAVAGWLSGALSDVWGPRRVIMTGLGIWLVMQTLFLTIGLAHASLPMIFLTYGVRGLGYPLFAFGFLVWITVAAPRKRMASAMGWFWFAFTGGLPTLGSLLASFTIPRVGFMATLWLSSVLVLLGGIILLVGVKEPRGRIRLVAAKENPVQALFYSIAIAWKQPKVGIACIVRAINTAPEFGFLIFLPAFFTQVIGFSMVVWLRLLSAIFLSNIIWNLLFGLIGDKFGWRRTIAWFGGFGCTLSTLALYYLPKMHHSLPLAVAVGALYGCTLAGYVPLSALTPALAPAHKGASLALLSLGAGASVWLGPAVVGVLLIPIGVQGVMWVFAGMYLLSGILALTLTTGQPRERRFPHMAWLCIDAGTSVIKSVVFSDSGRELATARASVAVLRPYPEYAEQNMRDVWQAVCATARRAIADSGETIHAIATTAQGDGAWLVDGSHQPVANAILWNDGRAVSIVNEWHAAGALDEAAKISGSLAYPGLPCSIWRWLDQQQPEILSHAAASLTCNGWLFLNLTGHLSADLSDASNPFCDVRCRAYSHDLLCLYGVEAYAHLLPPIRSSAEPARLLAAVAAVLGVPANIPVVMAPYDIVATAWGGGAIATGQACVILGTTICAEVISATFDTASAGTTIALEDGNLLRAMPTLTGCEALAWAADLLKLPSIEALGELAATAPLGSGDLLFLPYLSPAGERSPFLNPHARASFHGLSLAHDGSHLARAVYEGLSFVIRECLNAASSTPVSEIRVCGGGARSTFWCRMIADVTNCDVIRPAAEELGARGAFLYGRTQLREMPTLQAAFDGLAPAATPDERFTPNAANHQLYTANFARFLIAREQAALSWSPSRLAAKRNLHE